MSKEKKKSKTKRQSEAAREKKYITYKVGPISLVADFSEETLQVWREWNDAFKMLKGENSKMAARGRKQKASLL
jgi:hypothetical protein